MLCNFYVRPLTLCLLQVDADFFFTSLNPTYFPGVPSSVEIHSGFVDAHDSAAPTIISAVRNIIAQHGVTKVAAIGHSLGGAIAILGEGTRAAMDYNLSD